MQHLVSACFVSAALLVVPAASQTLPAPPPAEQPGLQYDAEFYDAAAHDPEVSTPERLLGIRGGQRAATHAEIMSCFQTWERESPHLRTVRYATSYEGRELFYAIITSPQNMTRLEEIREGMSRIADPRRDDGSAARLARELPAVAWLAYSIHGDELSGSDAALLAAYHLASSTDDAIEQMREDLIIIIDPLMNPDGRDRFIQQIQQHDGHVPNGSAASIVHHGYWPWGRTNHYLFDLNRDWIFGVHPETRGRIDAIKRWHPLMMVDCHEMGGLDTYLFSPSRAPVNPNLPARRLHWWEVFASDHAKSFDVYGWRYYTGEWNEEWYPGYSSSWAGFRGAVGILYEQAGVAHHGMERPEGTVLTYRESVHHQYVSTMANLKTFHTHHRQLMEEFLVERRAVLSDDNPVAQRMFAVLPTKNAGRLREFVSLLDLQGVEVYEIGSEMVADATDHLGQHVDAVAFPEGTLLIPNRQPEGALISALLEFDPHMTPDFLQTERRSLLRRGESKLYDVTAWNLTMMFGLHAMEVEGDLPADARRYSVQTGRVGLHGDGSDVAFVIDAADDNAVIAAARLMELGRRVRVAEKPFELDGRAFERGSFVINMIDNPGGDRDVRADIETVCGQLLVSAYGVGTGLGAGDLPDLGGEHFMLLERPRIALFGRGMFDPYDYGSTWFTLDHRMGMRATYLNGDFSGSFDLRPYNVLIMPGAWGRVLEEHELSELRDWVRGGGTLIAIGSTAARLAGEDGIGDVRVLSDALEDLDAYEQVVLREWAGRHETVDAAAVWSHATTSVSYPWQEAPDRPSLDELEVRDAWQQIFMPQGAMVAGRVDDEHWLTPGIGDVLPVLAGRGPVLMAGEGIDAPIRIGAFIADRSNDQQQTEPERVGWSRLPEGQRLHVRMSGLLWPEAAHRLANSAWVTRQRVGNGQVILFASSPTFRGSAAGMTRVLMNAVVCGPGCGASQPTEPQ